MKCYMHTGKKMNPSKKSEAVDLFLDGFEGIIGNHRKRRESILKEVCYLCGEDANIESMPSKIFVDEYKISGLCKKCQDEVYK